MTGNFLAAVAQHHRLLAGQPEVARWLLEAMQWAKASKPQQEEMMVGQGSRRLLCQRAHVWTQDIHMELHSAVVFAMMETCAALPMPFCVCRPAVVINSWTYRQLAFNCPAVQCSAMQGGWSVLLC